MRSNGGLIGVYASTSLASASGVWSAEEKYLAQKQSIWPMPPLDARYIRYRPTSGADSRSIALSEFYIYSDFDAGGTNYSGTATASYSYPSHPPENARDGNTMTMWWGLTGTMGDEWWQLDIGPSAQILKSFKISWDLSRYPTQYEMSYSKDGVNFYNATLYSSSGGTNNIINI